MKEAVQFLKNDIQYFIYKKTLLAVSDMIEYEHHI